jgi:S-DNA-T family DNA segregation ATPase FtsK/SpoIIIE
MAAYQTSTDRRLSIVRHYLREILFVLTVTLSIFLLISLLTYHISDSSWSHEGSHTIQTLNAAGKAGAIISDVLLYVFGYFAYLFPFLFVFAAFRWCKRTDVNASSTLTNITLAVLKLLGFCLLLLSGPAVIEFYLKLPFSPLPFETGGILGQVIVFTLLPFFNSMGVMLILFTSLLLGITLFTGLSWFQLTETLGRLFLTSIAWLVKHGVFYSTVKLKQTFKRLINKDNIKKQNLEIQEAFPEIVQAEKPAEPLVPMDQENLEPLKKEAKTKKTYSGLIHKIPGSNELPSLSLLNMIPSNQRIGYSNAQLQKKAEEVEQKLLDFGFQVKVVAFYPGPVVTRFELELAAGTKVNRISALAKDLARSLSVTRVRIVEVIPGKSVIGLELPNAKREIVTIHEVLESNIYHNAQSPLTLALGKDIAGHTVVVDLAKMPHLLVAGTTGAGKSVALNNMLLSMLYKSTPKHLRLILIDPKMLELSVYSDIPHLLSPVVTDMRDAVKALRWAVLEMERRYQLMAALSVRNIKGYNHRVLNAKKQGVPLLDPLWKAGQNQDQSPLDELPHIVIFADEFADMMATVGKKVELLITRLAQKARAAGIHLVLATQRPSVDVITGLIKANIATRIAFQVSSKVDSRTILDRSGAEQLLGYGDMLYLPPGSGMPVRVHGAYVDDEEVHRVVDFLKKTGKPEYLDEIFDDAIFESSTDPYVNPKGANGQMNADAEQDPLYDQAVEMVTRSRRVSTSSIQRQFKIGYNRAARIVEAMEAAGVVTPMESNGARTVLAPEPTEA